MRLVNMISDYFAVTDPWFSLALFAEMAVIAVLFLILKRLKPKWIQIGNFILFVVLVRCLLFGNQYSWGWYYQQLTVDDVGWRQQSAINVEYRKFFKYPGKKYLAVGSSQTYSLYHEYSQKHHDITVFNLAGMTPIDFYLYRDYIKARNPEFILLFLSEFDLAKEPSLTGAKIAPSQGLDFLRKFPVYRQISKLAHTELALKEMAAGELFPEYKYSFVFKGLVQKFMKKNESLKIRSLYEGLHPDSEKLKEEVSGTLNDINEDGLKYQVYFLREFLEYCKVNSLKVVIVEGQYNPLVRNETTERLNALTLIEIYKLARMYDNVQFISKSESMPLREADFDDSVHVKPESAHRFVEGLLRKVSSFDPGPR